MFQGLSTLGLHLSTLSRVATIARLAKAMFSQSTEVASPKVMGSIPATGSYRYEFRYSAKPTVVRLPVYLKLRVRDISLSYRYREFNPLSLSYRLDINIAIMLDDIFLVKKTYICNRL